MEQKQESKSKETLQNECNQITQEVLSLASLGDIMRAKGVCENVMQYGADMMQYGYEKALRAMQVDDNIQ